MYYNHNVCSNSTTHLKGACYSTELYLSGLTAVLLLISPCHLTLNTASMHTRVCAGLTQSSRVPRLWTQSGVTSKTEYWQDFACMWHFNESGQPALAGGLNENLTMVWKSLFHLCWEASHHFVYLFFLTNLELGKDMKCNKDQLPWIL
jgi:hypothetical protein